MINLPVNDFISEVNLVLANFLAVFPLLIRGTEQGRECALG